MGLLQDIQSALIASDRPLPDVLRMAKILAAKLDNALLAEWVDQELNGYAKDAPVPSYRASRAVPVFGDFTDGSYQARNVPISVIQLKADYREAASKGLFRVSFTDPIAAYEDVLRHDAVEFKQPWDHDAVLLVQPTVYEGMQCIAAWRVLNRSMFVGVVDGVRNRLLDLVLELERQVPGAGDVPSSRLPASKEQLNQIVQNTIYAERFVMSDQSINVHGTAGNIAGGQGNVVQQGSVQINQQGADLASLLPALRAAVQDLGDHLPPDQVEAADELVDSLEEEAGRPEVRQGRIRGLLQGLTAIATVAGPAGAAVIDAVQRIGHALGT
jgi:AbiTii